MAAHRSVSASNVEIMMDKVGVGVASQRPLLRVGVSRPVAMVAARCWSSTPVSW
jgi:hypothetical protein